MVVVVRGLYFHPLQEALQEQLIQAVVEVVELLKEVLFQEEAGVLV
jgi:hypothetical protein